ncbi:hypothetical protein ACC691_37095, partial [Rhizobium johnstonii]|uniref:hypothetical protein n=1 Tax=Rhizobium johnstonii TaxID=3019933 RepID=UPI003F9AD9B4
QADWEGLGAASLGTIVFGVFGVGSWRNVRRRRKARAAASTPDGIEADARNEPATEAATDAAEPAHTAAPVDLAEHSDTDSDTDATPSDADGRPVTPDRKALARPMLRSATLVLAVG